MNPRRSKRAIAPELPDTLGNIASSFEETQHDAAKHYGNPKRRKMKSRKETRAAKKLEEKQKRQLHHQLKQKKSIRDGSTDKSVGTPKSQDRPPEQQREQVPQPKKTTTSQKNIATPVSELQKKLLEDEQREIRRLEKLAGVKKKGKIPSSFDSDLAFLLNYKEDVPRYGQTNADDDNDSDVENEEQESDEAEVAEVAEDDFADEDGPIGGEMAASLDDGEEHDVGASTQAPEANSGSTSFAPTASAGKYVPPALRRVQESAGEQDTSASAIIRQVRGQLNRLALPNLESVCRLFLEQLYRQNPRSDVTSALVECLMHEFEEINQSINLKSFALVRAALVAVLTGMEGVEVGSAVLEALVHRFAKARDSADTKVALAAVHLLANLYNLNAVHCGLIYDVVRLCIAEFSGLDIELLLALLKDCGFQLRSDDPSALKEIILGIQERVNSLKKEGKSDFDTRITFMLDRIYDLKNNKQKAGDIDSALVLAQKFIKNFLNKNGNSGGGQLLRVGWTDLMDAPTKGRWWIVGAAWSGSDAPVATEGVADAAAANDHLLALAKAQRMNTDLRRTIFCLLLSAEDYMDAFEKLMKLGLRSKQDREIVYVLVHCATHESHFNPYYLHLANKLCGWDHNYKFTFQFNLWDKFKQMEQLPLIEIANLARLYAQMIGHFSLSLSILKALNFELLQAKQHIFVRAFFAELLSQFPEATIFQVFQRVCAVKDLLALRQGLLLFFAQSFELPGTFTDEQQALVRRRVKNVQKMLDQANFVF